MKIHYTIVIKKCVIIIIIEYNSIIVIIEKLTKFLICRAVSRSDIDSHVQKR